MRAKRLPISCALVVAVSACGGSTETDAGTDAPVVTDAGIADARTGEDAGITWSTWERHADARYRGQIFDGNSLASDPTVIRDGDLFRLYYTCLTSASSGGFCHATSEDGITWRRGPSLVAGIEGVAIDRDATSWDQNVETASAILRGPGRYELYYSGYLDLDANGDRPPAALGVATSTTGTSFVRSGTAPILSPTSHGRDGSDIFSADVFEYEGSLHAIYVGWCVPGYHQETMCEHGPAVVLLGADQAADGTWVKRDEPVLVPMPASLPVTGEGVAEPDLVEGPDGLFYLFFTAALGASEPRVTLLGRSASPWGPFEIRPEPLVAPVAGSFDACGVFAPSVLVDGDVVRMWYLAIDDCAGACPSCNFEMCGCDTTFSIGYATSSWPLAR